MTNLRAPLCYQHRYAMLSKHTSASSHASSAAVPALPARGEGGSRARMARMRGSCAWAAWEGERLCGNSAQPWQTRGRGACQRAPVPSVPMVLCCPLCMGYPPVPIVPWGYPPSVPTMYAGVPPSVSLCAWGYPPLCSSESVHKKTPHAIVSGGMGGRVAGHHTTTGW